MNGFIELKRTFEELQTSDNGDDEAYIREIVGIGNSLRWPQIIQEYRVIILSEAGSGKTAEILNIASDLKERGNPSFFIRIEHIAKDFEDAFEVGTYEDFQKWLSSGEEGWLFLDSIDEARLKDPRDFELAIRKLGRRISNAKERTHIIITGRTSAWRPKTDLAFCTSHLPYTVPVAYECELQIDDDTAGECQTETRKQAKEQSIFKIFSLKDLTSEQISIFVKQRGVNDNKAFLDAIERADAWSFTSRPQDLEELAEFWLDKGRIGTRLEIMRNSIDRRLSERDQGRADTRPLAPDRAQQGARLLAAATTLTKNPTIRVPDGAENAKGIAVRSVLKDWDDKVQSILLSRPIFDEAIYGTVRFHERTVREYLTAEWFDELLRRETSRKAIEALFFSNQYGLDIVVPTLRPILPWLAILDEKIREKVRKIAPEIFFEGGDPVQMPLYVRRDILYKVCEQMADGVDDRSTRDYAAVQRFANHDLTDDVRILLHKYRDNDDLTAFLFRMAWLGELSGVLPEAMEVALNPVAEKYTRIAAFRAVKAVGSDEDQEMVRQKYLSEGSELNRVWLAELLEGIHLTEQTLAWLLACLEKVEPAELYTFDHLTNALTDVVGTADIDLLPKIIAGLNNLLSLSPIIERRCCEVSVKFEWLIVPGSKAVERLIEARHSGSLKPDALSILHKLSALQGHGSNKLTEIRSDFSKLVPAWQELNRELFWFEVHRSRRAVDKKSGKRLTDFWRVSIFGPLWQFREVDFDYFAEQITGQDFIDDKLVALSAAFHIYNAANRPEKWREKLKKQVKGNVELSERLENYLKPPVLSESERRWKRQEEKWKKQQETERVIRERYHADWKQFLSENLDGIRESLREKPGTITNPLDYLHQQTRDSEHSSNRWTEYNWKKLIPEYGEEVARYYRDAVVNFWRNYLPKLRSEGAETGKTPFAVIIGLSGLEIEAIETKNWLKHLKAEEVELACRYASFELNGFPNWFPKLFEAYPIIICNFMIQEVRYELSIEKPEKETHYIIYDLSWSGQWAWDQIAPSVYEILKKEPKNLSNLDNLLNVIQGSSLSDNQIHKLAVRKCRTLRKLDHLARWFAVWTRVSPDAAISAFEDRILRLADKEKRTLFAMTFATHLLGGRRIHGASNRESFKTPVYLKSLYLLMHEYIQRKEDINRVGRGAYSPGFRDDAQDARDGLFNLLNQIPGKESFLALSEISQAHPVEEYRPWMLLHAKKRAEQDGDIDPWSPSQVRDFHERLERTPRNHRELAGLAVLRLIDLKDDLENGDSSVANILRDVKDETIMRNYIGHELRKNSFGRYTIPQEEELADAKRPDLRFHGVNFDGPVPVELKLADNNWGGPKLFERLENQLCGDYMRDNRSNRGIFVLVYRGEKIGWDLPGKKNRVDFEGLTVALHDHWQHISPKFPNVDEITVIGIDLTKRTS